VKIEDVIAERITKGREELGLTQAQVGEQLGAYLGEPWPRQAVSSAEKGVRAFRASELIAFALVLGRNVEALIEPPPEVDHVTIGDGPPLDSRHLRVAASTTASANEDLRELAEKMMQLRRVFPGLAEDVKQARHLMEAAYRELWTAISGRGGIEISEEELRERQPKYIPGHFRKPQAGTP
jgi:transcriptional regulator with XRE-family HTH domain